jgi:hypothetical protein
MMKKRYIIPELDIQFSTPEQMIAFSEDSPIISIDEREDVIVNAENVEAKSVSDVNVWNDEW